MFGFTLNTQAGGVSSGWNTRQTYIEAYDPRGFHFHITVSNLLSIIESTTFSCEKGLNGEFIYGWDSKDLVLISTLSPEYYEIVSYSDMINKPEKLKTKDLVLGGVYRTNDNKELIYLGRFVTYSDYYSYHSLGSRYFFQSRDGNYELFAGLTKIVKTISTVPIQNYKHLIDRLEHKSIYSPIDETKDIYIDISYTELKNKILGEGIQVFFTVDNKRLYCSIYHQEDTIKDFRVSFVSCNDYTGIHGNEVNMIRNEFNQYETKHSLEEIHNKYKFKVLRRFLKNGKERE